MLHGRVVVTNGASPGTAARLRLLGPGSMVGEMELLSGAPRSAWMFAEGDLLCRELSASGLDTFSEASPAGAVRLLRNIACMLGSWLREPEHAAPRADLRSGDGTGTGTERPAGDALRDTTEAA